MKRARKRPSCPGAKPARAEAWLALLLAAGLAGACSLETAPSASRVRGSADSSARKRPVAVSGGRAGSTLDASDAGRSGSTLDASDAGQGDSTLLVVAGGRTGSTVLQAGGRGGSTSHETVPDDLPPDSPERSPVSSGLAGSTAADGGSGGQAGSGGAADPVSQSSGDAAAGGGMSGGAGAGGAGAPARMPSGGDASAGSAGEPGAPLETLIDVVIDVLTGALSPDGSAGWPRLVELSPEVVTSVLGTLVLSGSCFSDPAACVTACLIIEQDCGPCVSDESCRAALVLVCGEQAASSCKPASP